MHWLLRIMLHWPFSFFALSIKSGNAFRRFWLMNVEVEKVMTKKTPLNEALRIKDGVIDQRQQQIDPAGKHRVDQNATGAKRSQKQPGQDLRDPQETDDE